MLEGLRQLLLGDKQSEGPSVPSHSHVRSSRQRAVGAPGALGGEACFAPGDKLAGFLTPRLLGSVGSSLSAGAGQELPLPRSQPRLIGGSAAFSGPERFLLTPLPRRHQALSCPWCRLWGPLTALNANRCVCVCAWGAELG
jgi:hypothetical protein